MLRRYGPPPRPDVTYTNRPGAYAIITAPGGLLITWQGQPHFEFQLPGGGIDPGEAPLAALHREVMEETGWRIAVTARLGAYLTYKWMPEYRIHARKVCHVFAARALRRAGPPSEPFHEPVLAPAEVAAATVASAGDRAFLRAHLRWVSPR